MQGYSLLIQLSIIVHGSLLVLCLSACVHAFIYEYHCWHALVVACSTLCRLEGFTFFKALGLAMSMAGTLMVGLSDDKGGGHSNTVGGDVLCLAAAIM